MLGVGRRLVGWGLGWCWWCCWCCWGCWGLSCMVFRLYGVVCGLAVWALSKAAEAKICRLFFLIAAN